MHHPIAYADIGHAKTNFADAVQINFADVVQTVTKKLPRDISNHVPPC